MWHELAEDLPSAVPDDTRNKLIEWQIPMDEVARQSAVKQEDLDAALPMLAPALDVPKLTCLVIVACTTKPEQQRLFAALDRCLGSADNVVLDITHGYRHLPFLLSYMLMALHWTTRIKVSAVYYGSLEMADVHTGEAPVLDLSLCVEYTLAMASVASWSFTGTYRPFAEIQEFKEISHLLTQSSFLENINRLREARTPALNALRYLGRRPPASQPLRLPWPRT